MQWFIDIIYSAVDQIIAFDSSLVEIVGLTLIVSLSALVIAIILALPTAAWLSLGNGYVRRFILLVIHAMMSFPPVLAGLFVYMLLSRQGPLGDWGLLFSPTAMIIAQVLLIFPIVCGLSQQVFHQQYLLLNDLFFSLQMSSIQQLKTIIYEGRLQLLGAFVSGLGRGLAEVGAVMIVGGNIAHHTRTITTAIALETSKGELVMAVSLGLILLLIAICLNALLMFVNYRMDGQRLA